MTEKNNIQKVIDGAEEVCNPLEGLAQKSTENPGAPFAPDALASLASLKSEDMEAFEALRHQLKKSGVRVTALDEAIAQKSGKHEGRDKTQADILIQLAEVADLFHSPDDIGYADIQINGHRETWPIRSKGFKRWLARRFYEKTESAPNSEALQSALNLIEARAHFDGVERKVFVRVGGVDGRLYLDLGDEKWRVVEISPDGWSIVNDPPVRFRRSSGMQAIADPCHGESIDMLRPYLNLQNHNDFVLVVAWILAVLRDRGPYPVIALSGEQGSAKSTFSSILKKLLDPNVAPLRALPREDRDLFIMATNGYLLTFDNVSGLAPWISDTLCRLATGGGFAVRQLYTDQDEVLFNATRPVLLNGIEDIVARPDLADRAIFLTLEAIPEEKRMPEKEFWVAFEKDRPYILGALLDAVSLGLRLLPETSLEKLPRMADFALWATACETAFWSPGTFSVAYAGNQDDAVDSVIEGDPVGSAVRTLMSQRDEWSGTATELLGALGDIAGDIVRKAKAWPSTPQTLSGRLRRAATFLRKTGIGFDFQQKGRNRTRTITIFVKPENKGDSAFIAFSPFAQTYNTHDIRKIAPDDARTQIPQVNADIKHADATNPGTVHSNPLNCNDENDADDENAKNTHDSGGWELRV